MTPTLRRIHPPSQKNSGPRCYGALVKVVPIEMSREGGGKEGEGSFVASVGEVLRLELVSYATVV